MNVERLELLLGACDVNVFCLVHCIRLHRLKERLK